MTIVVVNKQNSWPLLVNLAALWREVTLKYAAQKWLGEHRTGKMILQCKQGCMEKDVLTASLWPV